MSNFSVESYNSLPSIGGAHKVLNQQLDSCKPKQSIEGLIDELSPLFTEGEDADQYGVCILHHHYALYEGERMVTKEHGKRGETITRPTTDQSANIVADRWMFNGEEFEHTFTDAPKSIKRPSVTFFNEFRRILRKNNVDILGICVASGSDVSVLEPDQSFLERPGCIEHREQITTIVHKKDWESLDTRPSAWVPFRKGGKLVNKLRCKHNCVDNCMITPKPPKPIKPSRIDGFDIDSKYEVGCQCSSVIENFDNTDQI